MRVNGYDEIVFAIYKHIARNSITGIGTGIAICIDKSVQLGVVITGLEIVETGLIVIVIAAVTQGVDACLRACSSNNLSPRVVGIGCDSRPGIIYQANDIALQIQNIVISCKRAATIG